MLDLRAIRQDTEGVRQALARKHEAGALEALDSLLQADATWRALLTEAERLRAQRNALSAQVAQARRAGADETQVSALTMASREVASLLKNVEAKLDPAEAEVRQLLLRIPNLPDADVPDGTDETDNREVRRWGQPRAFAFPPRPHWDLGVKLGWLDFERAGKIAGSRFTIFRGDGARVLRGLISFMLDLHIREHGCHEVLPPFLVNSDSMLGTGNLPKFGGDAFRVSDHDFWLIPTAEVPVTNLYRDEILPMANLPLRHVAYTPCWRSEAGAAGRDTRGLIRQHQFDKVEIVHFTTPEQSAQHLHEILSAAEAVLQLLELPYRVIEICTADLGFSQARKYDLEVWLPSYQRYVEISSCSNYRDFQARRANIRFRRHPTAAPEYVHTLNGSALAVGRTLAALLENHQTDSGGLRLPPVLAPYLGDVLIR
jgi:seryl-tRNA synthetase